MNKIIGSSLSLGTIRYASWKNYLGFNRVSPKSIDELIFYSYRDFTHPFRNRPYDEIIEIYDGCRKVAYLDYGSMTGQIAVIRVNVDYQRQGVGTAFLNHAIEHMKEFNVKHCWAVTSTDPATPIYQLFAKYGAKYSNPADAGLCGVTLDGLRFEIDHSKTYPKLKLVKIDDVFFK